jgi:hypothetical protein
VIAGSTGGGRAAAVDRGALELLYRKYNDARYVSPDPLEFVYRYESGLDREVVALVA